MAKQLKNSILLNDQKLISYWKPMKKSTLKIQRDRGQKFVSRLIIKLVT